LNKTNSSDVITSFLDLNISIINNTIVTKIYVLMILMNAIYLFLANFLNKVIAIINCANSLLSFTIVIQV
jgi:hypothetical protein